jgi:hypothetical protein
VPPPAMALTAPERKPAKKSRAASRTGMEVLPPE